MPFVIGLLFLSSLWNSKKTIKHDLNFLYLTLYYLVLIGGIFISNDKTIALSTLENSATLVLFPIIFMVSNINFKDIFHKIMIYFIEGVLLSFFIAITFSFYKWFNGSSTNPFLYTEVSPFHHTSYMALYCTVAIAYTYFVSLNPQKSTYISSFAAKAIITLLSIFSLLLMSKTGIIVVFLTHLIGLSYWIIKHNKIKIGLTSLGIVILTIVVVGSNVQSVKTRFTEIFKELGTTNHSESSTGARLIGWEVSWEVIQEHPFFGIGTGDVSQKMSETYISKGHNKLALKSLNSHNQFLTTGLQSGLIGFCSLIFILAYPLIIAMRTKTYFTIFFIPIILINFMTESMLQTQSGVVFIAFMLSLFLGVMNCKTQNEEHVKN